MGKKVTIASTLHKECIIEIQAFRGNKNEFLIKELVIMDLETNVVVYFLFKPPFSFKRLNSKAYKTNKWLIKNYHFINWNEGFTNYKEIDNIMYHYCQQYTTAYTSGFEKSQWIQQYMNGQVIHFPIQMQPTNNQDSVGFCLSVLNPRHKTRNCVLMRAFTLLNAIKTKHSNLSQTNYGGGEDVYINSAASTEDH